MIFIKSLISKIYFNFFYKKEFEDIKVLLDLNEQDYILDFKSDNNWFSYYIIEVLSYKQVDCIVYSDTRLLKNKKIKYLSIDDFVTNNYKKKYSSIFIDSNLSSFNEEELNLYIFKLREVLIPDGKILLRESVFDVSAHYKIKNKLIINGFKLKNSSIKDLNRKKSIIESIYLKK